MREGVACYIGNGVVVDPAHLLAEIARIEALGVEVRSRLFISESCPLILPFHVESTVRAKPGAKAVPRQDRHHRQGHRPGLRGQGGARRACACRTSSIPSACSQAARTAGTAQRRARHVLGPRRCTAAHAGRAMEAAEQLKPLMADVGYRLHNAHLAAHNLLFEGAQGTLLDIDHGTYPFVTSSNCVAGNAAAGAGVGPGMLHYVLGITKAYTTRVGSGPFPTELPMDAEGSVGHHLSTVGQERGTVTGRARRCGWLDAPP
jgi:adenylosuccinate synthase